jgi:hypothetical protein
VAGNAVRAPQDSAALNVRNHRQPQVVGNDFGSPCDLIDVPQVRFSNNDAWAVNVNGADAGTVTDNRVATTLRVFNAAGNWQLSGNRVGDLLLVLPVLHGVWFPVRLFRSSARTRASSELHAIAALSRTRLAGTAGRTLFAADDSESAAATGAALAAAANPRWRAGWQDAISDALREAFLGPVAGALAPVLGRPFLLQSEEPYQVQAVGNWAAEMQIGLVPPGNADKPTNEASVALVVGNRAERRISVNWYRYAVVAHNITPNISPWQQQDQPVRGPNVQR